LQIPRLVFGPDEAYRCETMLQKITFAFKNIKVLTTRPVEFGERFFNRVFEKANIRMMSNEEYNKLEKDMTTELDRIAQINTAFHDGERKGKAEEKEEIARKMLSLGISHDIIKASTELSDEQLGKLEGV